MPLHRLSEYRDRDARRSEAVAGAATAIGLIFSVVAGAVRPCHAFCHGPRTTTAKCLTGHGHPLRRYRQPPQSFSPRLRAERRRDRQPARHFAHGALSLREGRACEDRDAGKTRGAPVGVGADVTGRRRGIRRLRGQLFRTHAPDRGELRAHHRARGPDLLPLGLRRLRSGPRRHLAGKHPGRPPWTQARARSGRRDRRAVAPEQGQLPTPPARHRQTHLADRDGALLAKRSGRSPRSAGEGAARTARVGAGRGRAFRHAHAGRADRGTDRHRAGHAAARELSAFSPARPAGVGAQSVPARRAAQYPGWRGDDHLGAGGIGPARKDGQGPLAARAQGSGGGPPDAGAPRATLEVGWWVNSSHLVQNLEKILILIQIAGTGWVARRFPDGLFLWPIGRSHPRPMSWARARSRLPSRISRPRHPYAPSFPPTGSIPNTSTWWSMLRRRRSRLSPASSSICCVRRRTPASFGCAGRRAFIASTRRTVASNFSTNASAAAPMDWRRWKSAMTSTWSGRSGSASPSIPPASTSSCSAAASGLPPWRRSPSSPASAASASPRS